MQHQMSVAINSGIRLLDEKGPDEWWENIPLHGFDVSSECHCVLGVLYGNFQRGLQQLHLPLEKGEDFGFLSRSREEDYPILTDAWKSVIRHRRKRR